MKTVITDIRIDAECEKNLKERGFDVLKLPMSTVLQAPVSAHPDMLLFFAKDGILTTREYAAGAPRELSILSAHTQKEIVLVDEDYYHCKYQCYNDILVVEFL